MVSVERLKTNLERFSFPRIYGSEAERRAFDQAKRYFEDLNLIPETQSFKFSNVYSVFYSRFMALIVFGLLFIPFIEMEGLIFIISYISLIIGMVAGVIFFRKPERITIGKKFKSQNLYTKIESNHSKPSNNIHNHIFFLAHLDSKGQRFHIVNRVKMYMLWVFSIMFWALIIVLKNYIIPQFAFILFITGMIPCILNIIAVILIMLNTTNNKSQGALDDASGIACVLELLNHYSNPEIVKELKNMILWFCLTGAEEGGTIGIRHFYKIIKKNNLKKDQIIVINFDAIGTMVDLIKFGITSHNGFKLREIFLRSAQEIDLTLKTRRCAVGVHTDGYFLNKKGYQGLEFGDWESYRFLHSIFDTLDKVDPHLLAKICIAVINSLHKINNHS